jgi:mono/diheme cytochrome c family protein
MHFQMRRALLVIWTNAIVAISMVAEARLTPEQVKQLPPAASSPVDFAQQIKPIFEGSCIKCHGRGRDKGHFQLDTRDTLLKGGESGPAVVPGRSEESLLIEMVSGLDPDNVMPKKGSKLTKEQVALLRGWIDQGVKWDGEISFARGTPRNLIPRKPAIQITANENAIDAILRPYFGANHMESGQSVSDNAFARRVYLDVVGMIPTPEELGRFASESNKEKRIRLVRDLLGDKQRYAENWLTFWNDALRNDYRGTGYIDGGRKQITAWLFEALVRNAPYDKFVAELIAPNESAAGFTRGIVWRGVVNASQVPAMQAAQNVSQVFMGVNLKCASCHDSFVNDWTLAEAYGLANIYSDEALEIFQCDKPTGRKAGWQFLYPQLGALHVSTNRSSRLNELADIITDKKNGRLSRTIVNRLWARFFGRGLVEPVDEMENPAWNQDLLDWLAEDLVEHGYDLKRTIEVMLTSAAYQMPSVQLDPNSKSFVFTGPLVRRLSAEQFRDALGSLTGVWYANPEGEFDFSFLDAGSPVPGGVRGNWIWAEPGAAEKAPAGAVYFRKQIELAAAPTEAFAVVSCDNNYTLYINGTKITSGKDFTHPQFANVATRLKQGRNVIAIKAVNNLQDNTTPPEDKPVPDSAANPAGLFFSIRLKVGGSWTNFGTDSSWTWSREKKEQWETVAFNDTEWKGAAELGDAKASPWRAESALAAAFNGAKFEGHSRTALANADPLTVSLGRPNREQVMTTRASAATTLQALELTNGETLAKLLDRGAQKMLRTNAASAGNLIGEIYQKALGRKPTETETQLASDMVANPVSQEGIADLIWSVAMLPEFQLIY